MGFFKIDKGPAPVVLPSKGEVLAPFIQQEIAMRQIAAQKQAEQAKLQSDARNAEMLRQMEMQKLAQQNDIANKGLAMDAEKNRIMMAQNQFNNNLEVNKFNLDKQKQNYIMAKDAEDLQAKKAEAARVSALNKELSAAMKAGDTQSAISKAFDISPEYGASLLEKAGKYEKNMAGVAKSNREAAARIVEMTKDDNQWNQGGNKVRAAYLLGMPVEDLPNSINHGEMFSLITATDDKRRALGYKAALDENAKLNDKMDAIRSTQTYGNMYNSALQQLEKVNPALLGKGFATLKREYEGRTNDPVYALVESLDSYANKMTNDMLSTRKGPQTDNDYIRELATFASSDKTLAGQKMIMTSMMAKNQLDYRYYEAQQNWNTRTQQPGSWTKSREYQDFIKEYDNLANTVRAALTNPEYVIQDANSQQQPVSVYSKEDLESQLKKLQGQGKLK